MDITFIGMSPYSVTEVRTHSHEEWEVLYFYEGDGIVTIGEFDYEFERGVIMIIPPLSHSEKSINGFRNIYIRVKNIVLPFSDRSSVVSIFKDTIDNDIGNLMNLCYRTYQKKENHWEKVVNSSFDTIYQLLISMIPDNGSNLVIENLKNTIIENITNCDFDIRNAIIKNGYSTDHMRKIFKAATGYTPLEYLTNLRVEYALKMISLRQATGFSLKEICSFSGFSDPYYFSRVIKAKTGKCPKEWSSI